MACRRCGNPKWEGVYPICTECVTCRTCLGSGFVHDEVPLPCPACSGKGWTPKPLRTVHTLTANRIGVRLPITVSFQFLDTAITLEKITGSASDLKKQPFLATITYAGYTSDGYVGGTEDITDDQGNVIGPLRIFIPVKLMESRVAELIGKGVFAADTLDTHDNSVEVGQFVDSYMERIRGTEIHTVRASGFFDKRSNEELIAKIIDRARARELWFSYDLKDAPGHIDAEINPGENILVLDDFKWRGATVLHREAAAYYFTQLAAKRAGQVPALTASTDSAKPQNPPNRTSTDSTRSGQPVGDPEMTKEELLAALAEAQKPMIEQVTKLAAQNATFETRFTALEAAVAKPPVKEPVKETVLTAADLATSVATATATAVAAEFAKALKAAGIEKPEDGKGKRSTFSAADLQTVKRYAPESLDADGNTSIDGLSAAIEAVKDNAALTAEGKVRALDVLVPMRNQLAREAMLGVN